MYFYGSNLGPPVRGLPGPRDLCLKKLGKGPLGMQCYIPNFKHLSKMVLSKKFFFIYVYFSMYFHVRN